MMRAIPHQIASCGLVKAPIRLTERRSVCIVKVVSKRTTHADISRPDRLLGDMLLDVSLVGRQDDPSRPSALQTAPD
jgi:hypothetical protein